MNPIKKVRLSGSVIDAVKETITVESSKPGYIFYSENELTRKLEVSRSPTREALRGPEVTGGLSVRPEKGIYIADSQQQGFKTFSDWLKNNEQEIKDNFDVRLIVEPKAARSAAEKADKEDLKKLQDVHNKFVKFALEQDTEDAIIPDGRFHRLLAGATKNNRLHILMKAMTKDLPTVWVSSLYTPGRLKKNINEDADILDAVKKHDKARAENGMTLDPANALNDITKHLNYEFEPKKKGSLCLSK
jgi:GntR family transcriptional repressor for pyruvate dehydrogenase complex